MDRTAAAVGRRNKKKVEQLCATIIGDQINAGKCKIFRADFRRSDLLDPEILNFNVKIFCWGKLMNWLVVGWSLQCAWVGESDQNFPQLRVSSPPFVSFWFGSLSSVFRSRKTKIHTTNRLLVKTSDSKNRKTVVRFISLLHWTLDTVCCFSRPEIQQLTTTTTTKNK